MFTLFIASLTWGAMDSALQHMTHILHITHLLGGTGAEAIQVK